MEVARAAVAIVAAIAAGGGSDCEGCGEGGVDGGGEGGGDEAKRAM